MHRVNDKTVRCCCGSDLPTRDIYKKGIFVARVCDKCKERKLASSGQLRSLNLKSTRD